MPTREAIVVNRETGESILDMDPADLEVTTSRDVAIPEGNAAMDLLDSVVAAELRLSDFPVRLTIVWSSTRAPVRFLCPVCDDVCDLNDGVVEDMNDNTCAIVCPDCLD
jgi:hypothetical protein